jgi:hypothetical protein
VGLADQIAVAPEIAAKHAVPVTDMNGVPSTTFFAVAGGGQIGATRANQFCSKVQGAMKIAGTPILAHIFSCTDLIDL